MKKKSNRRQFKRLRVDKSVKIPVQIFPVLPFIGESIEAALVNISLGGMALVMDASATEGKLRRRSKIKIHFRLPGQPLSDCSALVSHLIKTSDGQSFLGIRFLKTPASFQGLISKMISDTDRCDARIIEGDHPFCETSCAYHSLCRKPLRMENPLTPVSLGFEIAFQQVE